ncbi:MAG: protein kinase [Streptomyces sp.]|nr:protein kinase [Streptomyces sp.]
MQRPLCPVETMYVGQRSRAVVSCSVRGPVDDRLLAAAFTDLLARHPTLRCAIAPADGGFALRELDAPPRLETYGPGERTYADEINTPLPVGGPLVRAVLMRGDGTHSVVLSVDHTISDGGSALALHDALWARYGVLLDAPDAPPEPYRTTWPVPVTELLPPCSEEEAARYFDERVRAVRARPVELLPHDAAPQAGGGRIEVARFVLDAEHTTALRAAASAAQVSVHGLIVAALLTTVRRRLGGDGPRSLSCFSPLDLRSRLTPPLPSELMVAAVSFHTETLDVAPDSDPLPLARQVRRGLNRAGLAGEPFTQMRVLARAAEFPAVMLSTVIATNLRAITGPRLPAGLELRDLRLVPARENYFPQAGRGPVMACITTFDGRLAVEFPYWTECFGGASMAAFSSEVRSALLDHVATRVPAATPAL